MGRLIKYIIGVLILVFLVWYLYQHWDKLHPLLKLSSKEIFLIYLVTLIVGLISSYVTKRFLRILNIKTSFSDMFMLQNAGYFLNYLPMKFGTIFRAAYLKHHYGLIYAHFGVFFVYLGLIMALSASSVGIVVLVMVYGFSGYELKILAVALLVVLAFSLTLILAPLPIPKGNNKFSTNLRNFLNGRSQVILNKKELFVCTSLFILSYFIASVRLGIIYHSLGQNVHPAGYLVLGAMGYVMMFINLTPGAIGIRELVLGSCATALGISLEVGILAAIIDRAVALVWTFTIGVACTLYLWHKAPEDFKKVKEQVPET